MEIRNGKISLLEDIIIDSSLPKWQVDKGEKTDGGIFNNVNVISGSTSFDDGKNAPNAKLYQMEFLYSRAPSWWLKIKIWLYKKMFVDLKNVPKKITPDDLKNFFNSVKGGVVDINKDDIEEVLAKYNTVLENAKSNNQIALIDKINDYAEVLKTELLLSPTEFNRYLTEESIVRFHGVASVHEKYKTGLCLTYIKNFIKVIPEDITELKQKADMLKIFDNYVILHYDYYGESIEDTKAEKEKKKDPVLFGVIKGTTNLYYIGDWIDDYCDLTLDEIIKEIGEDSVKTLDVAQMESNIEKI